MTRERDVKGMMCCVGKDDTIDCFSTSVTVNATADKDGKTISFQAANIMIVVPVEHVDDMIDIVDGETKGDYVVVRVNKDKTVDAFAGWEDGEAIIAPANRAMFFEYKSKAEEIAEELGKGWKAEDINPAEMRKVRRLLAKITEDDEE